MWYSKRYVSRWEYQVSSGTEVRLAVRADLKIVLVGAGLFEDANRGAEGGNGCGTDGVKRGTNIRLGTQRRTHERHGVGVVGKE